jgi:hypothetical protein
LGAGADRYIFFWRAAGLLFIASVATKTFTDRKQDLIWTPRKYPQGHNKTDLKEIDLQHYARDRSRIPQLADHTLYIGLLRSSPNTDELLHHQLDDHTDLRKTNPICSSSTRHQQLHRDQPGALIPR